MRGKKEQKCFAYIQNQLFFKNDLEIDIRKSEVDRLEVTKRPMNHFFAMSEEDICEIEDIFYYAHPNDKPSDFPDFISSDGWIEHFQITSSEVTNAGAMYKKAFSMHEKDFEKECDRLKEEMEKIPYYGEVKQIEKAFSYKGSHSHENLMTSLKKSVDDHIKSASKYPDSQMVKVFLIEYDELTLRVQIDYPTVKPERMYGDLLRREEKPEYRISRDKEALTFLYEKHEFIDYVVFATDYDYEFIRVSEIPELLKLLVYDYEFHPVVLTTVSCMYGTNLPANDSKDV